MAGVTSPDALLRRVEVRVGRRLDGLLQGERQGRRPGPGGESSLTRAYEPGDDVRWIDWPLTARSPEAMVRVPELEPVLTAWALVDLSPSMVFGTHGGTKVGQAREVLAALGAVLRRRGDRLGIAATTSGGLDLLRPPRGDRSCRVMKPTGMIPWRLAALSRRCRAASLAASDSNRTRSNRPSAARTWAASLIGKRRCPVESM